MTRRNRVTPFGELVADPARGALMGNRGVLHDDRGEIVRGYRGIRWIACRPAFRGRRRALMQPGRYTELFFLDEATAMAAGHRPCAECRRGDYRSFLEVWPGAASAPAVNAQLHGERGRRYERPLDGLPDGVFVLRDGDPWLVRGARLWRWTPAGYVDRVARPAGETAVVVTPPSSVTVLERGWRPRLVDFVHPSAGA